MAQVIAAYLSSMKCEALQSPVLKKKKWNDKQLKSIKVGKKKKKQD
jgi:hypothetical protein